MDQRDIERKLEKIDVRLANIDITLAKQEVNLAAHMKRSDILEKQVEPLKEHLATLHGLMKLAKALGVIIALIEAVRLFK